MAEIIKAATRDGYGKALVELGAINDKLVVLDADLAEATKTAMFKKAYPDRFFDTGIAECNMIGVAGDFRPSDTLYLPARLQCSPQAVLLSR